MNIYFTGGFNVIICLLRISSEIIFKVLLCLLWMIAAVGHCRRAVWRSLLPHIREELRTKLTAIQNATVHCKVYITVQCIQFTPRGTAHQTPCNTERYSELVIVMMQCSNLSHCTAASGQSLTSG